eukprot:6024503-Amphidinium_carterae.1
MGHQSQRKEAMLRTLIEGSGEILCMTHIMQDTVSASHLLYRQSSDTCLTKRVQCLLDNQIVLSDLLDM